ncbi:uncharacterized protein LOC101850129 [Aplysia californica]|uniref:Uncharacterized protein LOC101850129 n=1 Tax=Aplysia californica TaxID=6500 RepID=A0ABM0K9I9_APLCA|nr:uncharacterized protein LOC101850129 [Aplysia californica]
MFLACIPYDFYRFRKRKKKVRDHQERLSLVTRIAPGHAKIIVETIPSKSTTPPPQPRRFGLKSLFSVFRFVGGKTRTPPGNPEAGAESDRENPDTSPGYPASPNEYPSPNPPDSDVQDDSAPPVSSGCSSHYNDCLCPSSTSRDLANFWPRRGHVRLTSSSHDGSGDDAGASIDSDSVTGEKSMTPLLGPGCRDDDHPSTEHSIRALPGLGKPKGQFRRFNDLCQVLREHNKSAGIGGGGGGGGGGGRGGSGGSGGGDGEREEESFGLIAGDSQDGNTFASGRKRQGMAAPNMRSLSDCGRQDSGDGSSPSSPLVHTSIDDTGLTHLRDGVNVNTHHVNLSHVARDPDSTGATTHSTLSGRPFPNSTSLAGRTNLQPSALTSALTSQPATVPVTAIEQNSYVQPATTASWREDGTTPGAQTETVQSQNDTSWLEDAVAAPLAPSQCPPKPFTSAPDISNLVKTGESKRRMMSRGRSSTTASAFMSRLF